MWPIFINWIFGNTNFKFLLTWLTYKTKILYRWKFSKKKIKHILLKLNLLNYGKNFAVAAIVSKQWECKMCYQMIERNFPYYVIIDFLIPLGQLLLWHNVAMQFSSFPFFFFRRIQWKITKWKFSIDVATMFFIHHPIVRQSTIWVATSHSLNLNMQNI